MTRLEVIKINKKAYAELEQKISMMPEGLEKAVACTMTAEHFRSNKFMGGLSDAKAQRLLESLEAQGYTMDEAYDEYQRQIMEF